MAIDRVRKVWLICPTRQATRIPDQLAQIGLLHVAEAAPDADPPEGSSPLTADTRRLEARVRMLSETLDTLTEFNQTKTDLIGNFIPTPIETTRTEVQAARQAVEIDALHDQVGSLTQRRHEAEAAAERARERLAALDAFRACKIPVPSERDLRWTDVRLWVAAAKQARRVFDRSLGPEAATLDEIATLDGSTLVASVCLREDADFVAQRMRDLGFQQVQAPDESTRLDAYVAAVDEELAESAEAAEQAESELAKLAEDRRQVELVLGHWEEELATAQARSKMLATGRATLLVGYVREREFEQFGAAVAERLPQVSMVAQEPGPDDNVPVSLSGPAVLRPAQFLVSMYGLPDYFEFDPSAFLFLSFLVFFGMCLGDAVYGVLIIVVALRLRKRFRDYAGVRALFELLFWGGIASCVVGVATGAWASNVWAAEYLGEGNVLSRVVKALAIGDPLDKPMIVLWVALMMGVANQFWGIVVRMYSAWRKGDVAGALCDGGFWLLLLPGVLLLIAPTFVPGVPPALVSAGRWLAIAGAVGLVLTQGRKEKGILSKAVVGAVSLYGIVGTYGIVSFVSDVLSYSRLLALGLTTTIVGLAVNIVAGMVREAVGVAILGGVLFLVVAIPGHIFNVLISGLGAFIHSARLIFVEFFGRFYEPKAERFAPLGAGYGRIRVMD